MSTAAIGGASTSLASVMALAAFQESELGLAAAQIDASAAAGGGSEPVTPPSVQAPGTFEDFA